MGAASQESPEQVALDRLLENAYEEFQQTLLSAGARFVLWGSFSNADVLVENYLRSKGKEQLLDKRRTSKSRTAEENELLDILNWAAQEAQDYVTWVRKRDAQPILREILISYCSGFEACLKNISLVFGLAQKKRRGLDDQVFVPGDQFKSALQDVERAWGASGDYDRFRAQVFFEDHIAQKNPDPGRFVFSTCTEDWDVCRAAFRLRNAIVHQLSRPTEQEVIGSDVFPARWEIDLKPASVKLVSESMSGILKPFGPAVHLL